MLIIRATSPTADVAVPDGHLLNGRHIAGATLAFAVIYGVVLGLQAPDRIFMRFAAMDSGGELAIQDMIRRGYRPGVDFAYPYGLLGLLVGRAWYGLCGASPAAYYGLVALGMAGSAWGLARLAVARRVGAAGWALIGLAIPDLTLVGSFTSTQVIEQALLIHALAEVARGRRGAALAILAACGFVKPALAGVVGVAVLAAAGIDRKGREGWARTLRPAAIVTLGLAAVLAAAFGPMSVLRTATPAAGAAIYRAAGYGFFFGRGREFWLLPGAGLRAYFRHEVGFWLLGTALLAWGGVAAAARLARGGGTADERRDAGLVATCAAGHLVFVCALFGHRWTWVYSLPLLIAGLAVLSKRSPRLRWAAWGLAACLLVNDRSKVAAWQQLRTTRSPSAATLGLWATPASRAEWERALELTRGRRPVLLAMCDGAAALVPGFAPPEVGYLVPGGLLPAEARRKVEQLRTATAVIAFRLPDADRIACGPQLRAALADAELVLDGADLQVYLRPPR